MTHESGYFSLKDGTGIFHQCWLPEGEVSAALILVHGVAEHSGRYMNLVNALSPKGFAIYAMDHYGHGQSEGKRLFVPSFSAYTEALDRMVDNVDQWEPGKKKFIVGHSMGGLITAAYLLQRQKKVDGAILSGPAVEIPDHVTPLTLTLARIFSKFAPALGITRLDASDISRDPDVVRAYVNDPLVSTGKLTARLAEQMLKTCQDVSSRASQIRVPCLILQGGSDRLVPPKGATAFHGEISSPDKTIKIYPEKYHEIFNDPGYDEVFSDMITWLFRRIGR